MIRMMEFNFGKIKKYIMKYEVMIYKGFCAKFFELCMTSKIQDKVRECFTKKSLMYYKLKKSFNFKILISNIDFSNIDNLPIFFLVKDYFAFGNRLFSSCYVLGNNITTSGSLCKVLDRETTVNNI